MKQLICEMCGSNDLLKQDGVFICQTCGAKYSIEEAKKMMVEGTVEVTGTVKVDQSHLSENFLDMAKSAIASGNYLEAEHYCNKVIEIFPNNYQAFLYKGTATAWQSTFAKIRILETINCWQKAYANYDDKNTYGFLSYTDAEFEKIVFAMVNLAGSFVENGINSYKKSSYKEHLISILDCVTLYTKSINPAFSGDDICCKAAIAVIPSLMKCAKEEERLYHKIKPTYDSRNDFIEEYIGCIDLLEITAIFGQKDEAKAACYEKAAEVMQTINDLPFYIWSNGGYEQYKNHNNPFGSMVLEYKKKAEKAKREIAKRLLLENEKKRNEFWVSNSYEHDFLNTELKKSQAERDKLIKSKIGYTKIELLNEHISLIKSILEQERNACSQLSESEKNFIRECNIFWSDDLSVNDEYDAYLDKNPILKQAKQLTKERESLINMKDRIEHDKMTAKPDAIFAASIVLGLGVFIAFLGIIGEMVFFIILGALFAIGAGIGLLIFLKMYKDNISALNHQEISYKNAVEEYNATIDKMNAIPKYTGHVDSDKAIKIPTKIYE